MEQSKVFSAKGGVNTMFASNFRHSCGFNLSNPLKTGSFQSACSLAFLLKDNRDTPECARNRLISETNLAKIFK